MSIFGTSLLFHQFDPVKMIIIIKKQEERQTHTRTHTIDQYIRSTKNEIKLNGQRRGKKMRKRFLRTFSIQNNK